MSQFIAKLTVIKGSVKVTNENESKVLTTGALINLNDQLEITDDSIVSLEFNNDHTIILDQHNNKFDCNIISLVKEDIFTVADFKDKSSYIDNIETASGETFDIKTALILYELFASAESTNAADLLSAYIESDNKADINILIANVVSQNVDVDKLLTALGSDQSNESALRDSVYNDTITTLTSFNESVDASNEVVDLQTAGVILSDLVQNSEVLDKLSEDIDQFLDVDIKEYAGEALSYGLNAVSDVAVVAFDALGGIIKEEATNLLAKKEFTSFGDETINLNDPLSNMSDADQFSKNLLSFDNIKADDFNNKIVVGDGFEYINLEGGNDKLIVGDAQEFIFAGLLDAKIDAGSGDDVVQFGAYWDQINLSDGEDTVVFNSDVDFTNYDAKITNVENIYINKNVSIENISFKDVISMSDDDNTLVIRGDDSATLTLGSDFDTASKSVNTSEGSVTYSATSDSLALSLTVFDSVVEV